MKEVIPKISVLVITYNQEDVITRAIDSLISQKESIYEICVSDDCSTDNTWRILQDYEKEYPGLFVLNRNDHNLGIFENIEKSWTMPSGDIINLLSGDDECGKGWLNTVIRYIKEKQIDYKRELFCIYGDYKAIYPNGDSFVFKNSIIQSGIDPIRLTFRSLIGNRSLCYSKRILDKFEKVSQGRSHIAESALDKQVQLFSEHNYYIPCVGNIYYTGIGVSASLDEEKLKDREEIESYAQKFIEKHGYVFCEKDLKYLKYIDASAKAYRNKKISYKFKLFFLFFCGIDWSLGLKSFRLKRYLFAIARRIPHRKPLSWVVN